MSGMSVSIERPWISRERGYTEVNKIGSNWPREERKVTLDATWYYSQAEVVTVWEVNSPGGLWGPVGVPGQQLWCRNSSEALVSGKQTLAAQIWWGFIVAQAPLISVHSSRISGQQQETTALYLGGIWGDIEFKLERGGKMKETLVLWLLLWHCFLSGWYGSIVGSHWRSHHQNPLYPFTVSIRNVKLTTENAFTSRDLNNENNYSTNYASENNNLILYFLPI